MKKILFVSNISNKITNFSIPSIEAGKSLGYEYHLAANYSEFKSNDSGYEVFIHHIDIARSPFSLQNVKAYKQLINLLKKEKFDVIHCNTPIGGLLGRICGRKMKVNKIFYTAHGFHFYNGGSKIKNLIFKNAERYLAYFTDAIITINEEDFKAAKKFKLRKNGEVYFVPGVGINTIEYKKSKCKKKELRSSLGIEEDAVVLISMGDLIKRKNYSTSIKAIANASSDKIHFLICGKGPELTKLKKLAIDLGVEERIHFLGFRSDVKELLNSSDIFLFTTLQEGLPRSTMEAMASGLPCIVSNVRGNTDLIKEGNGGYLAPPLDFIEFSKKINKLSEDAALRERMGNNNLLKVKKFDVEKVMEKMKYIYFNELK